jgi:hypothetical protein
MKHPIVKCNVRLRTWDAVDSSLDRYLGPVRSVNIVLFAGFICTIIGGAFNNPTSSHYVTGFSLRRAGDILFLVSNVGIIAVVVYMAILSRTHSQRFDPILVQNFVVLPIMLTRIVYTTVQSWLASPQNPGYNVWVYFGLLEVTDFLSTLIFTLYGAFVLRPSQRAAIERANAGELHVIEHTPPQSIAPSDVQSKDERVGMDETQETSYRRRRGGGGPLRRLYYMVTDRQ